MKLILATILLILLLSACGAQKPDPNPTAATWDNTRWNESTWEE